MAAALAAVARVEALDAALPLRFLVSGYLGLNELMPPCRLRWSRRLGRPLMGMYLEDAGDRLGYAYIEELRPFDTLLTGIQSQVEGRPIWVTVRSRDVREYDREGMWDVAIYDENYEDRPFMQAWEQRYGVAWPLIDRRTVHPALQRLEQVYHRFSEEVREHGFRKDCECPEWPGYN
jgi:hypothetical protein